MTSVARHSKREKLTPEQARSFSRFSVLNATMAALELKCGCEPYVNVFTFGRWLAQGYAVQKGEKAIKLSVVREEIMENKETGEAEVRKYFTTSSVFCRCQVAPKIGGN